MIKRKMTDGDAIAARLYGLEIDDQEPKWLAAQIDRLVRKRMAEAWKEGWRRAWETPRVWTGDVPGNPYRGSKRKV